MLRACVFSVSIALFVGALGGCDGASCEPYAGNPGACNNFVGYTWNGAACVSQAGCLCEGNGCPGVYADLAACQRDHTMCGTDSATDVVTGQ